MAGTLTISTLSDGTNSTSATNAIQGSAKAWVNFNGVSGVAIRASYNISSITRNSTGIYTLTFTNSLPDANYCVVFGGSGSDTATAKIVWIRNNTNEAGPATLMSSSQLQFDSGAPQQQYDMSTICIAVFR